MAICWPYNFNMEDEFIIWIGNVCRSSSMNWNIAGNYTLDNAVIKGRMLYDKSGIKITEED